MVSLIDDLEAKALARAQKKKDASKAKWIVKKKAKAEAIAFPILLNEGSVIIKIKYYKYTFIQYVVRQIG